MSPGPVDLTSQFASLNSKGTSSISMSPPCQPQGLSPVSTSLSGGTAGQTTGHQIQTQPQKKSRGQSWLTGSSCTEPTASRGSELDVTLCCPCLEIFRVLNRAPRFHFALGPQINVAKPGRLFPGYLKQPTSPLCMKDTDFPASPLVLADMTCGPAGRQSHAKRANRKSGAILLSKITPVPGGRPVAGCLWSGKSRLLFCQL